MSQEWEVLALRYATHEAPMRELGLVGDAHDALGRLDYFIWLIRGREGLILVDTGFGVEAAQRRGRRLLRHPVVALNEIGVRPEEVRDIVITHLHYDHAGNLDAFPNARFHLQEREMSYATGRCMCDAGHRRAFDVDNVVDAVRLVYQERIVFHDGAYQLAPGIGVHLVGGHSLGLQVLTVDGARRIVLASDALHLSRLMQQDAVFPIFADRAAVLEGYRLLKDLAGHDGVILPGHDPQVMQDFPLLSGATDTVRIG
ncbi:N-acyl homoserine lactonase family protein [Szabonella alba]|uniref:N-acyl homoserine lactonase family protein n=1 Tax=Szabonella alba TaxID=2804194 RepID=A0A8K0VBM6_9RHOB|nr:N-acyl homoserine lactonase family protein [Szabonella alba]MBL4919209.1 N-acyl homoserine lactonase family protein [Szabonella alba]